MSKSTPSSPAVRALPVSPAAPASPASAPSVSLEAIESKIAYLERANTELSDVVFTQHREIEALRAQLRALSERLDAAREESGERSAEEERPPHY